MMYHTGSFIRGESLIYDLDPRVKLVAAFVFSIFILWIKPAVALVSGIALLLAALAGGLSLRVIGQSIKPFWFFIALIFIVHVFFSENQGQGAAATTFLSLSFSRTGFQEGFWVIWRFFCLVLAAVLLTMTTAPSQLIAAIKYFLKPLRKLRAPVDDLAVMIMLALRLMPILLTEKERIETAQRARGYDLPHSGLVTKIKVFLRSTLKILLGVFRRADEIALAMESRNYRRGERSSLVELKLTSSDYPVIFFLLFFFFIFVAINSHFG
ncbi:MAG: energy-coupling factor transporter transmembrane protein EcfT [Smithella sp.]|nr:energy-coupling factor transporter transmembrane protein EcfT [Smithella sp.]MDM7987928.1 energy-coupling factor transporter transmembrane component T [Smithella sp.]HOU49931.1 energy-coupling factor transporter transmembrane component T [Smithella sp.]HQG64831.1 energy-coupling factor transporter transmembrane component T [Smithella sp.]HQI72444.1 energy-coupling factor transporter transmembrane component T [Smithella sp.]